jgi:hypothetical protein
MNFAFKTSQNIIFESRSFEILTFNPTGLFKYDSYVDKDVLNMKINRLKPCKKKKLYLLKELENTLLRLNADIDYPFFLEKKLYSTYKDPV